MDFALSVRPSLNGQIKMKLFASPPSYPAALLRGLGLLDATFLVIGGVLGSGILMTTGQVAARLLSPILVLPVFVVGGFIALSGALTFVGLEVMFPCAGGPYIYLREAYGPPAPPSSPPLSSP